MIASYLAYRHCGIVIIITNLLTRKQMSILQLNYCTKMASINGFICQVYDEYTG